MRFAHQVENGITRILTEPTEPAAAVADLKALLRIDGTDEDSYLNSLLMSASSYASRVLNRTLITSNLVRQYDETRGLRGLAYEYKESGGLSLTYPPIVTVTRVYALDSDGVETDIDGYYTDFISAPARLYLTQSVTGREIATLRIEYTAGYGDTSSAVPSAIQQGILQHAAFMYEHRGDCDAKDAIERSGAMAIYRPYKVVTV